jgi:putative DNA primase/helicase
MEIQGMKDPTQPTQGASESPKSEKAPDLTSLKKKKKNFDFGEGEDVPGGAEDKGWKSKLLYTNKQELRACVGNAVSILVHDLRWKGVLAFNLFNLQIIWRKPPPWKDEDFAPPTLPKSGDFFVEEDGLRVSAWLGKHYDIHLTDSQAANATLLAAKRTPTHPVREYLQSLKWDGTPRINSWLIRLAGAPDNPYVQAVSSRWLISAVARIMEPGCFAKYMLILEGDQDLGKSSLVKALSDPWFTDELAELGSKDSELQMQGVWVIEEAELEQLRKGDINKLKQVISRTTDRFRPPYARTTQAFPRQSVFVGTVNGDEYLRDETGGVRFWPVKCSNIDLPAAKAERDQIWAEAYQRYQEGEKWYIHEKETLELAKAEQEERFQSDPWQELIIAELNGKHDITINEILDKALKLDPARWDQIAKNRVVRILRYLKWFKKQAREGKSRIWKYYPA